MAYHYYEYDESTCIPTKYKMCYVVDTNEEMESLDTSKLMVGSRCTVVQDAATYLLDSEGSWTKYYPPGSN